MWYGGYTLSISLRARFLCDFFHRMKSPMVGGGAIDAPSNVSRHTIWRKNHLKRRSFLVASSSPPWLNLYFCCYATKIKKKDHVQSTDLHCSKSVRITSWLPAIFYPQPHIFIFHRKWKYFTFGEAEYFIREAYFTFSKKIFHILQSRIY